MRLFGLDISRYKKAVITDTIKNEEVDGELFDSVDMESLYSSISKNNNAAKLVQKLRERSDSKEFRFKEYEMLVQDPIINQAIELMSDDATQFDIERERSVWIESSKKKYAEEVNDFLKKNVEPFIDSIASDILKKGEFAFKVKYDSSLGMKSDVKGDKKEAEDFYLLPVQKVQYLHHLILEGQVSSYVMVEDIKEIGEEELLDADSFVHFINYSLDNSEVVKLKVDGEDQSVFVLSGESILTDKIRETYRILRILEDAIIAYRLAKSKLVRIISVEVSNLSNEKASAVVNYVDGLINKEEVIDEDSGVYRMSRNASAPVSVVMPVKKDKGKISIDETKASSDIKDIVDLEYFRDKLLAGLRVPKDYLGLDTNGKHLSGTSLMRTDIRYARSVKKVQRVILGGVRDIVELYNKKHGYTDKDFKVKIVMVNTIEEEERNMEMDQKMGMVKSMYDMVVDSNSREVSADKLELVGRFFRDVVPSDVLANYCEWTRDVLESREESD